MLHKSENDSDVLEVLKGERSDGWMEKKGDAVKALGPREGVVV